MKNKYAMFLLSLMMLVCSEWALAQRHKHPPRHSRQHHELKYRHSTPSYKQKEPPKGYYKKAYCDHPDRSEKVYVSTPVVTDKSRYKDKPSHTYHRRPYRHSPSRQSRQKKPPKGYYQIADCKRPRQLDDKYMRNRETEKYSLYGAKAEKEADIGTAEKMTRHRNFPRYRRGKCRKIYAIYTKSHGAYRHNHCGRYVRKIYYREDPMLSDKKN